MSKGNKSYTFSVQLQVDDVDRLLEAAKERAIEGCYTLESMADVTGEDADEDRDSLILAALLALLDPGASPPGTQIFDSGVSDE